MDSQDATAARGLDLSTGFESTSGGGASAEPAHHPSTALQPTIEQRREARYSCSDPAQVRHLSGDAEYFPANIEDISRSGLRLNTAQCFLKGQEIQIKLPGKVIVFGEVRYFRCVNETYQMGVRIVEVFHCGTGYINDHVHEDQLWLYSAGKGLTGAEVVGVRVHLLQCGACSALYRDTVKAKTQLAMGAAKL